MLRNLDVLQDFVIRATDGTIGHVTDFYFDDHAWTVRYVVVDTGTWLLDRKVLISPISVGHPDWLEKVLPVSLTKEQVKDSPDIDTDRPVSRQQEITYFGYYGYPFYWGNAGPWGAGNYPSMMMPGSDGFVPLSNALSEDDEACARIEAARHRDEDPHLRSCNEVVGYHLHASDGDIGHVQGLVMDEETWAIRYFIIETSNWWLGHQVLIAPQWIEEVSWATSKVSVSLPRQMVKDAPPYDPSEPITRTKEILIHEHYQRVGYWVN